MDTAPATGQATGQTEPPPDTAQGRDGRVGCGGGRASPERSFPGGTGRYGARGALGGVVADPRAGRGGCLGLTVPTAPGTQPRRAEGWRGSPSGPAVCGRSRALPPVPALSLWVCLQRACVFAARMVLPRLCLFTRTGARSMREEAHGLSLCPRPGSRQRTEAAAASELSRLQWLTPTPPCTGLGRPAEGYLGFVEYVQTPVV